MHIETRIFCCLCLYSSAPGSLYDTEPLFCFDLISLWLKKEQLVVSRDKVAQTKAAAEKAVSRHCFWLRLQVTLTAAPKAQAKRIRYLADAKLASCCETWQRGNKALGRALTGCANAHLFCHGTAQLKSLYSVAYPVTATQKQLFKSGRLCYSTPTLQSH